MRQVSACQLWTLIHGFPHQYDLIEFEKMSDSEGAIQTTLRYIESKSGGKKWMRYVERMPKIEYKH